MYENLYFLFLLENIWRKEKSFKGTLAGERFSIQVIDGEEIVVMEDNIFEGAPKRKWVDVVKDAKIKFKPAIPIAGKLIRGNADKVEEYSGLK